MKALQQIPPTNVLWLVVVILFTTTIRSQQLLSQDSLELMEDEALLTLFNRYDRDSLRQEQIARTYLERARREADTIKMARGYDRLALTFHSEKNLAFADSIIALTGHLNHKTYPALGYMIKGAIFHNNNNPKKATENYLKAELYAKKAGNRYNELFIKRVLVDITLTWSNPEIGLIKAQSYKNLIDTIDYKEIFHSSVRSGFQDTLAWKIDFAKEKLRALDFVIIASIYNEQFEMARSYVDEAIDFSKKNIPDLRGQFNYRLGEILFYQKFYNEAIRMINESKGYSNKPLHKLNTYFYLGSSKLGLGETIEGINYLLKADSIYDKIGYIQPSHAPLFFELYNYYSTRQDEPKRLEYLHKIIETDSMFKLNYRDIYTEIINDYETPLILEEKEKLIDSLEIENNIKKRNTVWLITLLLITLFAGGYYAYRQQVFKKRYKALREEQSARKRPEKRRSLEISTKVTQDILDKLEGFALEEGYLNPDITLNSLAEKFDTNSNYLSRIINFKLEKNFSDYLNDLRVAYALKRLSDDKRFRHYTIKAIAQSSGYRSADSFSRAFYQRHGIYPSYYLKKLDKEARG